MRPVAALVLLMLAVPAGCGDKPTVDGECGAKVRYDGTVYRALATHSTPLRGDTLGRARYGDCDGSPVPGAGPHLYAVPGVDAADAVLAAEHEDTVYVAEALAPDDWPPLLHQVADLAPCRGPAEFSGRLDYVAREGGPRLAGLDARAGTGLELDHWARRTVVARVPATFERDLLAAAQRPGTRVVARTRCDDAGFVLTDLEIAP